MFVTTQKEEKQTTYILLDPSLEIGILMPHLRHIEHHNGLVTKDRFFTINEKQLLTVACGLRYSERMKFVGLFTEKKAHVLEVTGRDAIKHVLGLKQVQEVKEKIYIPETAESVETWRNAFVFDPAKPLSTSA